jgi:hypothetical protein
MAHRIFTQPETVASESMTIGPDHPKPFCLLLYPANRRGIVMIKIRGHWYRSRLIIRHSTGFPNLLTYMAFVVAAPARLILSKAIASGGQLMGENVTEETTPRKQNILAVRRFKSFSGRDCKFLVT